MSSAERPSSQELINFEQQLGGEGHSDNEGLSFETPVGKVEVTTDLGGPESKYQQNEDSAFVVSFENTLTAGVIDGAGGEPGGGFLISSTINRGFREALNQGKNLQEALDYTYQIIDAEIQHKCYATAAIVQAKKLEGSDEYEVTVMGAGDSQAMTVRENKVEQEGTTEPQNNAHWLLQGSPNRADYYNHPELNKITGGIGPGRYVRFSDRPIFKSFKGKSGNMIILCSDGVRDIVSEEEIRGIVIKCNNDAKQVEQEIVALALERNNTKEAFVISHDAKTKVTKKMYREGTLTHPYKPNGDNITVAVMRLA